VIFIPRASGAEVNDKFDWWFFEGAADQLIDTKILSEQAFVNLAHNRLNGRQGEMPNKLANQSRFERGLKRETPMLSRTWHGSLPVPPQNLVRTNSLVFSNAWR